MIEISLKNLALPEPASPKSAHQVPEAWNTITAEYPRELSISQIFEAQVGLTPDALALRWDGHRFTYRQLNEQANQLAHALRELGVGLETPVGIFMHRSADLVVAMIAICKAGGSYVPLDPTYPKERLGFMLQDAAVPILLTHTSTVGSVPECAATVLCVDKLLATPTPARRANLPPVASGDSRAYVIYTSGSTGQPKGAEILHRGIGRLVKNTNYIELNSSDRVAQLSNASFDAATFEIWGPLCNGAQIVGISKEITLSPRSFAALITEEGLTTLFLTTALFNLVAKEVPDAFRSLRHLLVGGEAHNPRWVAHIMKHGAPERFINVYGPTECTTFASWHLLLAPPALSGAIPIGIPISNTQLFILDEHLRPLPIGVPGELYIGGDGVARGYLNQPELTRERFLESPYLKGVRLYKTGDQARWLPEGVVDFLGRLDHQVKIRGFRIELNEVRAAILEHSEISDAAVIAREDSPGDKQLVAYLVAKDTGLTEVDGGVLAGRVNTFIQNKLPSFMLPARYLLLPALPLTVNGKLNRDALPAPGELHSHLTGDLALPQSPTEIRLAALWVKLLRIECAYRDDNFFDSGGNSLLAAQLHLRIQDEFHIEVPIYTIFEKATLGALSAEIATQLSSQIAQPALHVDLSAEAVLEAEIVPCAPYVPTGSEPKQVLLTGATGFLGAYLLDRLLSQTTAQIYCLVRCASDGEAMTKLTRALQKYNLWNPRLRNRIVPVRGDLTRVRFGIDPVLYDALSSHMDVVYHCGAHVSYVQPYSTHRRPNVVGTREVLRFACLGRVKPVHYISTIGIFGPVGYLKGVTDIYEDDDLAASESVLPFDMGYSQSKWVAEKMVFAARERGLPVSIYRPGFIIGDSRTGATNVDDFLTRIVIGCIETGSYPDLPTQRKEIIPVDYISDAIVHIARDRANLNQSFHLVPPESQLSPSLERFFELISTCGYPLTKTPYGRWQEQISHTARDKAGHILLPLLPIFSERIYEQRLTRWEVQNQMPRYHSENTVHALGGSGLVFPPLDTKLMGIYLDYLCQQGLIPPPRRALD